MQSKGQSNTTQGKTEIKSDDNTAHSNANKSEKPIEQSLKLATKIIARGFVAMRVLDPVDRSGFKTQGQHNDALASAA